jgi:hypothetical protein
VRFSNPPSPKSGHLLVGQPILAEAAFQAAFSRLRASPVLGTLPAPAKKRRFSNPPSPKIGHLARRVRAQPGAGGRLPYRDVGMLRGQRCRRRLSLVRP